MRTSEMVQSKFLKKEDLPNPRPFTVKGVSLEEVGQGDQRWVVWFHEEPKGLVLNVTKIRQLEAAYGMETDDWKGKRVRLSHDPSVVFAGKVVGGIKLETQKTAPPPASKEPVTDPDFDDDIPF